MSDCEICLAIEDNGWNNTGWYHCHSCHAKWKGMNKAHCNICHQTFSTSGAFDKHWTKNGHVDPSILSSITWREDRQCWAYPAPSESPASWKQDHPHNTTQGEHG